MSILKTFPLCSDQVQAIRTAYQTFNSQSSPRATGSDQARLFTAIPEIRVIQQFTPELVSAISTCPPDSVSDQCLARGIISKSKYEQVINIMYDQDKPRILLQAVKDNIAIDKRCFEIFFNILSKKMPHAVSPSLITSIQENHELMSVSSAVPVQPEPEEGDHDRLQKAIKKSDEARKKRRD